MRRLGFKLQISFRYYVGKATGNLVQYGCNGTFLFAMTQEYRNSNPMYYVIDMTKDSEYALEETFRVGPFTEEEYTRTWKQKLDIQLKEVK